MLVLSPKAFLLNENNEKSLLVKMVKKISDNNTKQYLGMHSNELVKRGLHCQIYSTFYLTLILITHKISMQPH